jgi:hypothetical protein
MKLKILQAEKRSKLSEIQDISRRIYQERNRSEMSTPSNKLLSVDLSLANYALHSDGL